MLRASQGGMVFRLMVKNQPTNAGDAEDAALILESGRPREEEMATHSRILAWKIPWTEEPEDYSPWSHKESRHN